MHIDLNEAVKIYARMCRARYGRSATKVVKEQRARLRAKGDLHGVKVWERLDAEIQGGRGRELPRQ